MRGSCAVLAATVFVLAAAPASAAGTWAKVSSDFRANTTIPALIQDGSDALVAWRLDTGPSTAELDAQRFASTVDQPYTPSGPRLVSFAGFAAVWNPALIAT